MLPDGMQKHTVGVMIPEQSAVNIDIEIQIIVHRIIALRNNSRMSQASSADRNNDIQVVFDGSGKSFETYIRQIQENIKTTNKHCHNKKIRYIYILYIKTDTNTHKRHKRY